VSGSIPAFTAADSIVKESIFPKSAMILFKAVEILSVFSFPLINSFCGPNLLKSLIIIWPAIFTAIGYNFCLTWAWSNSFFSVDNLSITIRPALGSCLNISPNCSSVLLNNSFNSFGAVPFKVIDFPCFIFFSKSFISFSELFNSLDNAATGIALIAPKTPATAPPIKGLVLSKVASLYCCIASVESNPPA